MLTRPDRSEYADFYADYIAKVPDGDVIAFLSTQPDAYRKLVGSLSDEAASARPQPGKWNAKEIIGHLCDAERIQSYRALRFARGDQKELQGFEQDDYIREAHFDARSLADLLDEFQGDPQLDGSALQVISAGCLAALGNGQRCSGYGARDGVHRRRPHPASLRCAEGAGIAAGCRVQLLY